MNFLKACCKAKALGFAWTLSAAALLVGCASAPPSVSFAEQGLWLDEAFAYNKGLVTVDEKTLFALDDDVLQALKDARLQNRSAQRRLQYLMDTVVVNKQRPFVYVAGHSTVASETWRTRAGDCLSLTVLTYAMAQELRLPANLQELNRFMVFDRRGGIDYRVGHVNVFIDRHMGLQDFQSVSLTQGVIIDFEPSYDSARIGNTLSSRSILARYYNNLGAEFLEAKDLPRAYAHFKAAIDVDPEFSAAQSNLAVLYLAAGHSVAAERVLTQAVKHFDDADAALVALNGLLLKQGRIQEAAQYQALLEDRQKKEPYYWIALGLEQLRARNFHRAVAALEKAQSLTTGFSEVHRYLALAYLQAGKPDKAQEQITTLALIDRDDPAVGMLNRKILAARKAAASAHL